MGDTTSRIDKFEATAQSWRSSQPIKGDIVCEPFSNFQNNDVTDVLQSVFNSLNNVINEEFKVFNQEMRNSLRILMNNNQSSTEFVRNRQWNNYSDSHNIRDKFYDVNRGSVQGYRTYRTGDVEEHRQYKDRVASYFHCKRNNEAQQKVVHLKI